MKPYIGITGFMHPEEVIAVQEVFPSTSVRRLMVGVLASRKTLEGIPGKRRPPKEHIHGIFDVSGRGYRSVNLIHYSSRQLDSTLDGILATLDRWGGRFLHGFQLNIAWPSSNCLGEYRVLRPMTRLVLQVKRASLEEFEGSPEKLIKALEHYIGIIDDVLLDPSEGKGEPVDPERIRPYLRVLRDRWSREELGLGVAGGLGPESLHLVEPLLNEFPDLSIDAEGRLRTAEDDLDIEKARLYVSRAIEMFERHRRVQDIVL